ncbi:MAG: PD-(D/E)XK nuclease family protein, partial [Bacteroidota bacterium]
AKKGLAYLGAMYRSLAQQVEQKLLHHEVYKHYLFVGFNALNKAEEQLIRKLLKAKKATVLWDSDRYFMEAHTENQAGKFLKKYKKDATLTPQEWLWEEDLLLNTEKEVVTIATNNAVMQAKVAQQLLREWGVPQKPISTGIILPDENLLLPTMYALDIPEINITMGLSLQRSTLYNLINTLFEMHQTAKHTTKEIEVEDDDGQKQLKEIQLESYYYKHIIKVLNHPFIRKYEQLHENTQGGISFIRDAINYMVRFNVVSLSSGELIRLPDYLLGFKEADEKDIYFFQYEHFKPLLRVIFQRWGARNATEKAIKTLQALCGFFERFYSKSNELEKHYVRKFKEIMQTLQQTLKTRKYNVDIRTLKVFIYQLIREERIAFDSERNSAVQIMGMLETRTLDFEQLIILSSNEKTLPPAKKATSLIPVDIATAFGLPTHAEQDAVMSYHFYRLLQRASRVALLYVNPSKTYGGEEKSRFILQIENDLVKRSQGKIKFSQKAAFADQALSNPSPDLVIEKSPMIEAAIVENLAKGLSPTHIDTFLKCSLRYYFEHIAGIQDAENVEEELGTDKFGVL